MSANDLLGCGNSSWVDFYPIYIMPRVIFIDVPRQLRKHKWKNQRCFLPILFWERHRLFLQCKPLEIVLSLRREFQHEMLLHCSLNLIFKRLHILAKTIFQPLSPLHETSVIYLNFFLHYLPNTFWSLGFKTTPGGVHANGSQVSSGPTGTSTLVPCGIQSTPRRAGLLKTCWEIVPLKWKTIQRTQDTVATDRLFPQCFFIPCGLLQGQWASQLPLNLIWMGLIVYVSLLLLTPKTWVCHFILKIMPSCHRLTPTLHSTVGVTDGSAECSPLHPWKASHGGHLHFKEMTFSKSVNTFDSNNRMWCLFLIWWHLIILKWTGATLCT